MVSCLPDKRAPGGAPFWRGNGGARTPEKGKASHFSGEPPRQARALHPGKKEKRVIPVVSWPDKPGGGTTERGKRSHSSGEPPRQDRVRHH